MEKQKKLYIFIERKESQAQIFICCHLFPALHSVHLLVLVVPSGLRPRGF